MLAAGTLASTRLVAPLLPSQTDWPLLSNPVIAMPLFVPGALWQKPSPSHGLAQLAYFLPFGAGTQDYVSGAVYETASLPPSTFVNQLPLGRRAGEALVPFHRAQACWSRPRPLPAPSAATGCISIQRQEA